MGFRPFEVGESLTASFSSIFVYEARGMTLGADTVEVIAGNVSGVAYRIAAGEKINATCVALANDIFTDDDEDQWKIQNGCSSAFVLIQLGPTQPYTITTGDIQRHENGSVTTLDSFSAARDDLAQMEKAALPFLLTSLTCLMSAGPQIELRKIVRANAGLTDSGQRVHDNYFRAFGTISVSQGIEAPQLASGLQAAMSLASKLNTKAARFFALGAGEDDELKKFLYYFLALEVQTHATFGSIDHDEALQKLTDPTLLPKPSVVALLQRQTSSLRALFDRFVWCAGARWPAVDEVDIEQFKRLKSARDDIAHGSTSEPPGGYANLAKQLAKKILIY